MPFNIGPGEIILFLAIALLLLGPGKLPEVGAAVGKTIREFRKASTEVQDATRLEAPPSDAAHAPEPRPVVEANRLSDATPPNQLSGTVDPEARSRDAGTPARPVGDEA
jgi:sec-independent protein translocase protein TatA